MKLMKANEIKVEINNKKLKLLLIDSHIWKVNLK